MKAGQGASDPMLLHALTQILQKAPPVESYPYEYDVPIARTMLASDPNLYSRLVRMAVDRACQRADAVPDGTQWMTQLRGPPAERKALSAFRKKDSPVTNPREFLHLPPVIRYLTAQTLTAGFGALDEPFLQTLRQEARYGENWHAMLEASLIPDLSLLQFLRSCPAWRAALAKPDYPAALPALEKSWLALSGQPLDERIRVNLKQVLDIEENLFRRYVRPDRWIEASKRIRGTPAERQTVDHFSLVLEAALPRPHPLPGSEAFFDLDVLRAACRIDRGMSLSRLDATTGLPMKEIYKILKVKEFQ